MKKLTVILTALIVICILLLLGVKYTGFSLRGFINAVGQNETAYYKINGKLTHDDNNSDEVGFSENELPLYYNSLENGRVNVTKDQGDLGSCWAFAANTALESSLLPDEDWDFSEDHMLYNNSFGLDASDGGDYIMAVSYLASWRGPVTEEADPYDDGITDPDASVEKHLQEALFLEGKDYDAVKLMILEYGAAESSIHISENEDNTIDSEYYNEAQSSYCYDGDAGANHELVIIGWDDSYPKENFNRGADSDGAFICLNSWGTAFGDNGVFYVSYCDSKIAETAIVYSRLENADNYDNIYQIDDCGWVGRVGFDESTAYFAVVFEAKSDEIVKAVSFYATDKSTTYKVYVCRDFKSPLWLLADKLVYAQGECLYAGYYTIDLDFEAEIKAGNKFAVIVEIDTPESNYPVAIEMNVDDRSSLVSLEGKESYISANGISWNRTQEESSCNVCLKAFTDYK